MTTATRRNYSLEETAALSTLAGNSPPTNAANRELGATGRAIILAVIVLGPHAAPDTVAALAGLAPRTFRYRNDGPYLKTLLAMGLLTHTADGIIAVGPGWVR